MKINIILLFFAMAVNSGIERPDYKVVKKYNNFEFIGPTTEKYKMIGNAVPPTFSKFLTKTILKLR